MDELCAIALAAADATGAEVAAAAPATASSRRSKPAGLSGSEWQLAKNRERNRLHARKSRARKKVFVESLRSNAEAFTAEWNTLRRLCLSVTGVPFRVRPPVQTDAAALSAAGQQPADGDADGDAEGEADASAAAGLRPGSKLRMDRVERSRERNKIHARRSRQRKKVLVEALEQSLASCRADIADMRTMLEAREGPHLSVLAAIPRAQDTHPMDGAGGAADGDEDEDDEGGMDGDDEGQTEGIASDAAAADAGHAVASAVSTGASSSAAHSDAARGRSGSLPSSFACVAPEAPSTLASDVTGAAVALLPPPGVAALGAGQRQRSNASARSARSSKGASAVTPSAAASTSWAGGNTATVDLAVFGAGESGAAGGLQGPALLSAATSSRVSGRQRKPSAIVAEAISEELSSRGKRSGGPISSGPGAGTAAGVRQVQGLAATLAAVTAAGRQRSREASPVPASRDLYNAQAPVAADDSFADAGVSHPAPSMRDEGGTSAGSVSLPGVDAMMLLSGAAAAVRSPLAAEAANSDSSRNCGELTRAAAGDTDGTGRLSDRNSGDNGRRSESSRTESRSPVRFVAGSTSGGNSSNSSRCGGSASSEAGSDTAPPGAGCSRPAAAVEQSNADRWGQYQRAQNAQLQLLDSDGAVGVAFGASSEEGDEDGEVPSQSGSAAHTVTGTAVRRFPSAASSASASSEASTATAQTATAFSVASRSTETGTGAVRTGEARASDASLSVLRLESAECAAAVPRKPLSIGVDASSALETAAALVPPCAGRDTAITGCKRSRSAWDAEPCEAAEHAAAVGGACGHCDAGACTHAPLAVADSNADPADSLQAKRARGNERQSADALSSATGNHLAHQPEGGTTAC